MSAEKRAKNIMSAIQFSGLTESEKITSELIIASQIREAVLDDRMDRTSDDIYKLAYEKGVTEGRERAAKLVEGRKGIAEHHSDTARAIRESHG